MCVCVCVSYQHVHHVWFVVSQCFDGVKHINTTLLPQHLTRDTNTAKHSTASSSITKEQRGERRREEQRGERSTDISGAVLQ